MCTLSWISTPTAYHLFFNRDETRTRPLAHPPSIFEYAKGLKALMPIDPVGGGSWLSVNQHGVSLALLNLYQGSTPPGQLESRGRLLKDCADVTNYAELLERVEQRSLACVAPFSLLYFDVDTLNKSPHATACLLRWDGELLTSLSQFSPLISSAFNYDAVLQSRLHVFSEAGLNECEDLSTKVVKAHRIHASHQPSRSAYSVCMHREDAHTVSFTQVSVEQNQVGMTYHDGPPCMNLDRSEHTLSRRS